MLGVDLTGLQACHICNNPSCCNPFHLYAGTAKENLQQAVREQRAFVGYKNGRAKLREQDVKKIRDSNDSSSLLAKRYNISKSTIKRIKTRQTWKHI